MAIAAAISGTLAPEPPAGQTDVAEEVLGRNYVSGMWQGECAGVAGGVLPSLKPLAAQPPTSGCVPAAPASPAQVAPPQPQQHLRELVLANCGVRDEGVAALGAALATPGVALSRVDLGSNKGVRPQTMQAGAARWAVAVAVWLGGRGQAGAALCSA